MYNKFGLEEVSNPKLSNGRNFAYKALVTVHFLFCNLLIPSRMGKGSHYVNNCNANIFEKENLGHTHCKNQRFLARY